jgi:hypothetical protein
LVFQESKLENIPASAYQMRAKGQPETEVKPIAYGEEIIILLKNCYIRSTEKWEKEQAHWFERTKASFHKWRKEVRSYFEDDPEKDEADLDWLKSQVTLSFQFGTAGNILTGIPIAPFNNVISNNELDTKGGTIILPRTQVKDYFTLKINVASTSMVMSRLEDIQKILRFSATTANVISPSVPGLNTLGVSGAIGIIGEIISLAAALNKADILISQEKQYVIDKSLYPTLPFNELFPGTVEIEETATNDEDGNPITKKTKIVLEIIRAPSPPADVQAKNAKVSVSE